jgi:cytochrome P450
LLISILAFIVIKRKSSLSFTASQSTTNTVSEADTTSLNTKNKASSSCNIADDITNVKLVQVDVQQSNEKTHSYIYGLHKEHGELFRKSTVSTSTNGTLSVPKQVLYSSNPETAAFVLTKGKFFHPVRCPDSAFVSFDKSARADVKCRSPFDLVQPMAKGTVFDKVGDEWKATRMCLAPLFTATEDVTTQFAQAAKALLPDLVKLKGGTVDTQVFSYLIFLKGTLNLLFGNELVLPQPCWDKLELAIKHFQENSAFTSDDHNCYTTCIYEPCEVAVEWALENADKCPPSCAFTRMVSKGFDSKAELIATTANFVVAAAESPASAMAHSVALVCGNPKIQAKMKTEIDEAMKASDGEINKSFCHSLKYVDAVIQESMRVKAPATMVSREAIDDCVLPLGGGKKINLTKGTKVNLCIHAVHLRKDVWGEDSEEFNPERWLADTKKDTEGLSYMPFSAGSRGCPGKAITVMWMKVLFALILTDYEISESEANAGGLTTCAASEADHLSKYVSWIPTGIYATFNERVVR